MDAFDAAGGAAAPQLDAMFSRLMAGADLAAFGDWFVAESGARATGDADAVRAARAMARALWAAVPMPANHWRPRGLPRIERNAPCHCGSGRKYKHCCAAWDHVELPFEPELLTALAISHAPPEALTPASVRQLPPQALAQAASFWLEQGQPEAVERVLGPLFEQAERLDGRHEPAFDILMDALLELGQQKRRFELAQRIGRHRDKALATAARAREVTMLADQGEYAQAWAVFRQAQRDAPDDPQLLHLELLTLLSEGRSDEARLRGPMLASKARRLGHDDLADVLAAMAEHGVSAVHENLVGNFEAEAAAPTHDWLALCARVPAELDADAVRTLYRIETGTPQRAARGRKANVTAALIEGMRWLRVRPAPALAALERRWQRRFPVALPELTAPIGNADSVLEAPLEVAAFLQANPEAWFGVRVVDDLLLAAQQGLHGDAPPAEQQAAWRLAEHALRLLRVLLGAASDAAGARAQQVGIEWAHAPSRPLLRLLAQAIAIGMIQQREVLPLLEWSLALNPIDNHGWRGQVADAWIAQGRLAEALALLDRYPDDFPPAGHRRALALHGLGRHDEAQAALRAAHAEYPAFMDALWPEMLDPPPADDGPGLRVGGATAAYQYRAEARADWVRSGALAWARGLGLPPAVQAGVPSADTTPPPAAARARLAHFALPAKDRQRLRRHYDWPRLHGFVTAIAWSPELVRPELWLSPVLQMRATDLPRTEAAYLKALNADMQAIMGLHNSLTLPVIQGPQGAPMPLALDTELAPGAGRRAERCRLAQRRTPGQTQGRQKGRGFDRLCHLVRPGGARVASSGRRRGLAGHARRRPAAAGGA